MTDQKIDPLAQGLAILASAYPRHPWPDAKVMIWKLALEDVDGRDVAVQAEKWVKTHTWPPSIYEMRRECAMDDSWMDEKISWEDLAQERADLMTRSYRGDVDFMGFSQLAFRASLSGFHHIAHQLKVHLERAQPGAVAWIEGPRTAVKLEGGG